MFNEIISITITLFCSRSSGEIQRDITNTLPVVSQCLFAFRGNKLNDLTVVHALTIPIARPIK